MPILGTPPTKYQQDVILTDGTVYWRTQLKSVQSNVALLEPVAQCQPGQYRVFPLHPEDDGLFEIHGKIEESAEGVIRLLI